MKKAFVLIVLFTTSLTFSQLKQIEYKNNLVEIGQIQPLGQPVFMTCSTNAEKNIYGFSYLDTEYKILKQYENFVLVDTGNDFETLYDIIIEGLNGKEQKTLKFELKDNLLWVNFVRDFGVTLVTFSSIDGKNEALHRGTSNMFTKKQIEKLFGKRN